MLDMADNSPRTAAVRKIQALFRKKRVFTNGQGSWKTSASSLTAKIVTFKLPTNFRSVFESEPKGFSEITGYKASFKKPAIRWVAGQGWIGDADGVNKIIAKKGQQTIVLTDKYFDVMGLGNYEQAILAIVRNGWAPKFLAQAPPTYKKIDGIFYVNRPFILDDLRDELKKLPASMVESIGRYDEKVGGVPAIVLKLKSPKWTYQFFKNGTVLFTGIKNPSERDAPRQLFKEFFTDKYDMVAMLAMNLAKSPAIRKPGAQAAEVKKAKLANRYPLASSWNAQPPMGFYVRPGTNGKPRLYKWRKMEKELQTGEWINRGALNMTGVGPKVAKAFSNAGVPIPRATLNAFARAGHPLTNAAPASVKKAGAGPKNRRAPSWNATKEGFYVRPGPGKQPYWFAVPAGIASGRKTVIKTYTEAGRNIPAAVRAIFKIPANVKTNVVALGNNTFKPGLQHVVKMGLNRVLRINNRQATRLTKPELLAIARNMNIPEANAKMAPARLIGLIQSKAGVSNKLNRAYDVFVNGTFYTFMNNGRVEKTTSEGVQTRRAWATIPVAEQNKIAKKLLPANLHAEYNATVKSNRFNALRAHAAGKKPVAAPSPPRPRGRTPSPPSPSNSNANNAMALEFEYSVRLAQNLGNFYRNGNEAAFLKTYGKLPVGVRGKPLKANVNRTYKKFVKETAGMRENEPSKARYVARIQIPNWLPVNKVQRYKNLVTNLAFQKPKPKAANIKVAIKKWLEAEVPQSPARAARTVENAITGEIKHIPAYVPKPRKTPNIPKRSPPPKKSPKPKKYNAAKSPRLHKEYALPANKAGLENLNNAMANIGLPTGPRNSYTWSGLVRAGLDPKFRNLWLTKVASPKRN
jgi:hypothetical protein